MTEVQVGTLVDFLRARLDEDEAVAKAAQPGPGRRWSWASVDFNGEAAQAHGYRHDPARVLAEVAAKRRILEAHAGWEKVQRYSHGPARLAEAEAVLHVSEPIVAFLAEPYASHPDYRLEWRP